MTHRRKTTRVWSGGRGGTFLWGGHWVKKKLNLCVCVCGGENIKLGRGLKVWKFSIWPTSMQKMGTISLRKVLFWELQCCSNPGQLDKVRWVLKFDHQSEGTQLRWLSNFGSIVGVKGPLGTVKPNLRIWLCNRNGYAISFKWKGEPTKEEENTHKQGKTE